MNKPRHLLGEKRGLIIAGISVIAGLVVFISGLIAGKPISENSLKTIQYFVLSLPIAWLITTEALIRFFLSSILSAIISCIIAALIFLIWLLFLGSDGGLNSMCFISLALTSPVFLILIFIINNSLSKSDVFGVPCKHCHVRGKMDFEQIDKQYLGQKYKNNDLYSIYKITDREWCNACGKEWIETRESEELDGNISKIGS